MLHLFDHLKHSIYALNQNGGLDTGTGPGASAMDMKHYMFDQLKVKTLCALNQNGGSDTGTGPGASAMDMKHGDGGFPKRHVLFAKTEASNRHMLPP